MLPVVLIGCAAWQRGRITGRDWLHTSPFFFLAAAFGLMSSWFQKYQALAGETLQSSSFWDRLAGAGQNYWFYLGKALLPRNLSIVYLRWKVDASTLTAWVPLLLLLAVFVLCWNFRRTWGRHVLFGLGCFAVTLFPALGFFDAQFLVKFQVSDHLQYLPLIAPLALVAAAIFSWLASLPAKLMGVALLLTLAFSTGQRAGVFSTEERLWRDTLAKNPAASGAHNDLGIILAKKGNLAEATAHFEAALLSAPGDPAALSNLGKALAMQGRLPDAQECFRSALKSKPNNPEAHENLAQVLSQLGRHREAILNLNAALRLQPKIETRLNLAGLLYKNGDFHEAAGQYRQVLSLDPKQPEPFNNLAWLLATCPDERVRNGDEAVRCAEQACQLTGFKHTGMTGTLAAAYAEAGRFPDAIAACEKVVSLATAAGDWEFAAANRRLLTLYRAGKPYHQSPPPGSSP
jgi:Flp pilus assembly protein TadD